MQRVLQNLRVDAIQLWTRFFDFGKLGALRRKADTRPIDAPRITSLLHSRVVEFLAAQKRPLKQRRLLPSRVQPEFVCQSRHEADINTPDCRLTAARLLSPSMNAGALRRVW